MKHFLKEVRSKKTYLQKSFSKETKLFVIERDKVCRVCGRPPAIPQFHHIYFRSQLFNDIINWAENCAYLCYGCHEGVTNRIGDYWSGVDEKLKAESLEMYRKNKLTPVDAMSTLESIFRGVFGYLPE
jgi:5-methylcytosine-specific restriction endonuclease McrA